MSSLPKGTRCQGQILTETVVPDEVVTSHGPIEADKENIRQEPYSLPQGFMWDTLDLGSAEVVRSLRFRTQNADKTCFKEQPRADGDSR